MTRADRVAIVLRPITVWPGTLTTNRARSPFDAGLTATEATLRHEVAHLGASEVVVQVAVPEEAFRIDGGMRAHAKPEHPGVIVSFDSRHGPLSYATDRFRGKAWHSETAHSGWHANLRAVALALEALRKVDRYGVGAGGEQYAGWKALGSGIVLPAAAMTWDEAARILGVGPDPTTDGITSAFRRLSREHHPDRGGDAEAFARITQARDLLLS